MEVELSFNMLSTIYIMECNKSTYNHTHNGWWEASHDTFFFSPLKYIQRTVDVYVSIIAKGKEGFSMRKKK